MEEGGWKVGGSSKDQAPERLMAHNVAAFMI